MSDETVLTFTDWSQDSYQLFLKCPAEKPERRQARRPTRHGNHENALDSAPEILLRPRGQRPNPDPLGR